MRPNRKQSYPDDFRADAFDENGPKRDEYLMRDSLSDLFDSKNSQPVIGLESSKT